MARLSCTLLSAVNYGLLALGGLAWVMPVAAQEVSALTLARYAFYGDLAEFEIPSGIRLCNSVKTRGRRRMMADQIVEAGITAGVIGVEVGTERYRRAVEDELKDGVCGGADNDGGFIFGA